MRYLVGFSLLFVLLAAGTAVFVMHGRQAAAEAQVQAQSQALGRAKLALRRVEELGRNAAGTSMNRKFGAGKSGQRKGAERSPAVQSPDVQGGGPSAAAADELAAARALTAAVRGQLEALRQAHASAQKQLKDAVQDRQQLRERVFELEADLKLEEAKVSRLDGLIEQAGADLTSARDRYNQELLAARSYMPEGVRVALVAINKRFSDDGHPGMRLLGARSMNDRALHEVQLLAYEPTSLTAVLYLAKKVTFDLDRLHGRLTLCFQDGHSQSRLGRENFPPRGKRLMVDAVDGARWEEQLPYLINAHGEYPALASEKPRLRRMDGDQRASWIGRLNKLLDQAKTKPKYRIGNFRTLVAGKFVEPLLLGYDEKKRLAMSAEPDTLWLFVDRINNAVEIRLAGGTIRRVGGDRKLGPAGFRIRLTGVRPADAEEAMLGMIKTQ